MASRDQDLKRPRDESDHPTISTAGAAIESSYDDTS